MIFLPLAGIIAEFNPLHNGHKYLIERAKMDGFDVACVISGNFVQRGDTAIIPKFIRAQSALSVGADLVLEMPIPWSMSTAQNFAIGGISQLAALGIDALYFGSECGDVEELVKISEIISTENYNKTIKTRLSSGKTFAKIRSEAISEILGRESSVLLNPNDTLAVEYITAAKSLGISIKFTAVKRLGAGHNDRLENDGFSTATLLREAALKNDVEYLSRYMPASSLKLLLSSPISNIEKLDTAIMSKLKQLPLDYFSKLSDISEGLDNLIYKVLRECHTVNELYDRVKSKRYTLARIRRLVLSAFLGIDNVFFLKEPPYVRVLGFSENGKKYLRQNTKPIITQVSQINTNDAFSKKVFDTENSANEIYALSLSDPKKFVNEQNERIIHI